MMQIARILNLNLLMLTASITTTLVVGFSPTHQRPANDRTRSTACRPFPMAPTEDDEDDGVMPAAAATAAEMASNVLGTPLQCCCADVGGSGIGTGFYRNGYCSTGEQDLGRHTVCCKVTDEFLAYSKRVGNDLSTKMPQYYFPGLKEGDVWCLCAQRWAQAYQDGMAPKIFLQATHEKTLDFVPFEVLREHAIDKDEADERLERLNEQRERLNKLL
jgi:hypothetical protein